MAINQDTPSVFGRSLEVKDGDLKMENGDFKIIRERNNFLQALSIMIETPYGTDIFNVNYGFDIINCISQPQGIRIVKELLRLNIVKTLTYDNRVTQIKEIVFDDEPRFFKLNPQADPEKCRQERKKSRRWKAIVLINTVTGKEETLSIEGVTL